MADESQRTRLSRRSLLGTTGAIATAGLAGCSGSDETATDGDDHNESDLDGGDSEGANDGPTDESQYQYVPAAPASWPRRLTGPSNTGYVAAATGAMTDLSVAQTIELPRLSDSSYVLTDGAATVEDWGTIYRYDGTGQRDWKRSPSFAFGPAVADGTVYALTEEFQLLALDGETGDRVSLEPLPLDGEPTQIGAAAFDEGRLYVLLSTGYGEHAVVAYDVADGSVVWENYVGDHGQVTMALGDGVLAVSESRSLAGAVRAYDPDTGDELWLDEELDATVESLAAQGDTVYALNVRSASSENYHYAFDAANGSRRWSETPSGRANSYRVNRFLADDDQFYRAVDEGYAAFDAATGERQWTYQLTDLPERGPVVTDDALYLARGNRLSVLDPESGDERWGGEIGETVSIEYLMLHADRLWFKGSDGVSTDLLVALAPGSDAS